MTRRAKVHVGTTNIFADLGLPDADTHFLKAQIVELRSAQLRRKRYATLR